VTVVFRTDIGPHTGKGSPLTKEEVDGNFYDLLTRTTDLESGGVFSCESVDYTGSSITFNWSDDTSNGPFLLPVATFRAVGEWTNSMPLSYLDIFTVTGTGTFLTLIDHTTPAFPEPFDPAAVSEDTATLGDPLYLQIGESVDTTGFMTFRGEYAAGSYFVGDVFTSADYGTYYVLIGHSAGATFDPTLQSGGNPVYDQIAPPPYPRVVEAEISSDSTYEISAADAGAYLRFTAGCVVSFPSDLDIAIDTEIHFRQAGDDPVMFEVGSSGVTLNPQRDGYDTSTPWAGATVTAKYVATDEWDLIGPHGEALSA
jgi:hypothetical protein